MPSRIPVGRSGPVLSVQLLPEVAARIRAAAAEDDRNVSQMIRTIINIWYRDRLAEDAQHERS